jgi:hypothetical protein
MDTFAHGAPSTQRYSVLRLDGGRYAVTLLDGATDEDFRAAAALVPPGTGLDPRATRADRTAITLIYRVAPPDDDAVAAVAGGPGPGRVGAAARAGWTPDVAATGPDPGLSPYQLAVGELLTAAPDAAAGGLIAGLIFSAGHPPAVVALADLLRDAHRRASPGVAHTAGCVCCAVTVAA